MNGYDDFFRSINDEDWERFAVDILYVAGFDILSTPSYGPDGGQDFIVEKDNIKYIVSCKHYIHSNKHVGIKDESDISDRIIQHNAKGFIGFYSTGITSSLEKRLELLKVNREIHYIIVDKNIISTIIPNLDTQILFKYGIIQSLYYMNVSAKKYKPLNCNFCDTDILLDENIPKSLAALGMDKENRLHFLYGCKRCFLDIEFYYNLFLEVEQALHLEQMIGWDELLDEIIEDEKLDTSIDFWKSKDKFEKRIRQRRFPQNYGKWYGLISE